MSYTKTTWATGDVVTSTKLNNIENGVSFAQPVMMTGTWDEGVCTFDMTYQEIYDAVVSGQLVAAKVVGGNDYYVGFVSQIGVASGSVNAKIIIAGNITSCYGDSASDYPSFED